MLPQDPTLFTGTIRENIDPFEQYTDSQLWDALEKAQMKEALSKLPEKLDTPVGEGGDSFSVGERQVSDPHLLLTSFSPVLTRASPHPVPPAAVLGALDPCRGKAPHHGRMHGER